MDHKEFDNIIIGAGPAGMRACAIAREKGESVCVVERREVGGTCLNRGCIPTKALVQSASVISTVASASGFGVEITGEIHHDYAVASARKDEVVASLRKGAEMAIGADTVVYGDARIVSADTVETGDLSLHASKRLIIASGSEPARLRVPGAELAVTSDEFLHMTALPPELVVIGGGVIGMECACIANAFGCKVTVVEYCREILPGLDSEMAKRLRSMLSRRGITVVVGAQVTSLESTVQGEITVTYTDRRGDHTLTVPMVMMAAGRRAVVPDGLSDIGIEFTPAGAIGTDDSMHTSVPGIYAIGDCNGRLMLAHAASAQAEVAMGVRDSVGNVPSIVFTLPECAQVGVLTSDSPGALITGKAMYGANGMASAMGQTEGFVKVAADAATRRIVGCCAIGAGADAIVQEAAIAIAASMTVDDLRTRAVFAHPTLSEMLLSALPVFKD
ncbi:FAD-dependent oxidoreductase [Muribaculum sp.]|uniref:dihydrolipoyl dehydrogenase family protein n=1 Tax=Muribaculum sp. TaxID=1918611 RepID=UPI0023C2EBA3|nr:FAD-dependent oxidoreductase [Muribaculum sp.]MDE5706519.1 FAD-dependent oxidoreductase [Muribaculum sp.]